MEKITIRILELDIYMRSKDMPAVEIEGQCEIHHLGEVGCNASKIKYIISKNGESYKVCADCVHLAEEMGWSSSFIEWRDS